MDTIKQFLKQYDLSDDTLNNLDKKTIDEIVNILNGKIKNLYDNPVLANYAALYYNHGNNDLKSAELYYLMAIKKNYVMAMSNLASTYKIQNNLKLAKKYYVMAIRKGNDPIAMNNLACIYNLKQKKYKLAELYYLMAIRNNNSLAMNNLAEMYKTQNNLELAIKYYLMAIEKDNESTINGSMMNNLACVYYRKKEYILAEKYYLMGIKKNCKAALDNLKGFYNNNLKLYYELSKISENNDMVISEINKLKNIPEIFYFENKKRLLSKTDICLICSENTLVIPRECVHHYCLDCFVKINECAICRF